MLPFSAVVPASQTPILYTAQVSDNVEDYYQTFHVTDVEELTDLDDQCSPARRPPHPTPLDTVFDTDQSLSGAELTETLEGMRVRLLATEKQLVTSLSTVQSAHRRIESAVKSLHVDSASLATAIATVAELRQVLKRSSTTTLSVVEFEGYEPGRQAPLSGICLSDLAPEHVPMLVDQLLARCNLYTRPANHGMVKPSDGPVQSWVAAHAALIELVLTHPPAHRLNHAQSAPLCKPHIHATSAHGAHFCTVESNHPPGLLRRLSPALRSCAVPLSGLRQRVVRAHDRRCCRARAPVRFGHRHDRPAPAAGHPEGRGCRAVLARHAER